MCTLGKERPPNLTVVMDNGIYENSGGPIRARCRTERNFPYSGTNIIELKLELFEEGAALRGLPELLVT
jgi:hypothetical protein